MQTKLKRDQIVPYFDAYMRSFKTGIAHNEARSYVSISLCHRLVANILLRRHYLGENADCIMCVLEDLPHSTETKRRAVRDGVRMGVIDESDDLNDRRRKLIKASQLLIDCFESTHVES